MVERIVVPPARGIQWPDNLRIGTNEDEFAPALLLHAVTAFEDFVVSPFVRQYHRRSEKRV